VDRAELYRGPLEDFVARRTASVRELRTKDPEAAAVIGKLRKPSVGVWAIDQLAVDRPALVAELLAAGADVRDAQQNVAVGSESREALLAVTTRLRDLVDTAARAAAGVLERGGKGASAENDRRIRATLQSAATGRAAERNALWTGTLDRDLEIAGFGSLDEPEDDPTELAEKLAPLRRLSPSEFRRPVQDQPSPKFELLARRDAEREAAGLEAVAQHARASADAKRRQADRLAAEAQFTAAEASAAEVAADAAEEAARAARLAVDA
jgi:hypothetical protein